MLDNAGPFFERSNQIKPQINLALPTSTRFWLINICAILVILQSSLYDTFSSFFVALGSVTAAILTEFIISYGKNWKILFDGSTLATALILSLFLPNLISPLYAAAGAAFAIAVIKYSFGGLGSNWLNPAAGAWLFIRFSWPDAFNRALEGSSLYEMNFNVSGVGENLRSFLNNTIFSITGTELPQGYLDLFFSRSPGIIADRGIFALLVGSIIIISFRVVNRSWIPAAYIAFFSILVRYAGALSNGEELWNGDILFALCSGGTLATAFFLVSDPVTGSKSGRGILLTALSAAGLAFLFRYLGDEPYGAIIALLCINAFQPIIRFIESQKLYKGSPIEHSSRENV